MSPIYLFAGWPACTSAQVLQQDIASLIGISILILGIIYIRKRKSDLSTKLIPGKVGKILATTIAIIIILFLALITTMMMSPWCT